MSNFVDYLSSIAAIVNPTGGEDNAHLRMGFCLFPGLWSKKPVHFPGNSRLHFILDK